MFIQLIYCLIVHNKLIQYREITFSVEAKSKGLSGLSRCVSVVDKISILIKGMSNLNLFEKWHV